MSHQTDSNNNNNTTNSDKNKIVHMRNYQIPDKRHVKYSPTQQTDSDYISNINSPSNNQKTMTSSAVPSPKKDSSSSSSCFSCSKSKLWLCLMFLLGCSVGFLACEHYKANSKLDLENSRINPKIQQQKPSFFQGVKDVLSPLADSIDAAIEKNKPENNDDDQSIELDNTDLFDASLFRS